MLESAPALTTNAGRETQIALPEKPLVIIEPRRGGFGIDLRELWAYRELLFFLAWRDVKVRYKQTLLGIIWVVIQPLLLTLVFTVFLGKLVRVPSTGVPYPLMVYTGLLPWTFFSSALLNSGSSIVQNAHLITKVYFPRIVIPAAAIGARLVDLAVSFVILIGLLAYYGVGVGKQIWMLPFLLLLLTMFTLALGMFISAINVKYRDVGMMLPVIVQLGMFVSPVLYQLSLVPESWRALYIWNPLVGIITGFRSSLLGDPVSWPALGISVGFTIVMFLYAATVFRRVERGFADVV